MGNGNPLEKITGVFSPKKIGAFVEKNPWALAVAAAAATALTAGAAAPAAGAAATAAAGDAALGAAGTALGGYGAAAGGGALASAAAGDTALGAAGEALGGGGLMGLPTSAAGAAPEAFESGFPIFNAVNNAFSGARDAANSPTGTALRTALKNYQTMQSAVDAVTPKQSAAAGPARAPSAMAENTQASQRGPLYPAADPEPTTPYSPYDPVWVAYLKKHRGASYG
jgi:hypothetical protein